MNDEMGMKISKNNKIRKIIPKTRCFGYNKTA